MVQTWAKEDIVPEEISTIKKQTQLLCLRTTRYLEGILIFGQSLTIPYSKARLISKIILEKRVPLGSVMPIKIFHQKLFTVLSNLGT